MPMDRLMKHVARNIPGNNMLLGRTDNIRFTVASTEPMVFAVLAKAPAKTNIHIISIMFSLLAPLLKTVYSGVKILSLAYADCIYAGDHECHAYGNGIEVGLYD